MTISVFQWTLLEPVPRASGLFRRGHSKPDARGEGLGTPLGDCSECYEYGFFLLMIDSPLPAEERPACSGRQELSPSSDCSPSSLQPYFSVSFMRPGGLSGVFVILQIQILLDNILLLMRAYHVLSIMLNAYFMILIPTSGGMYYFIPYC